MGTIATATAQRRLSRTFIVLAAALSLIATHFAALGGGVAQANQGASFTYNGFIDVTFEDDVGDLLDTAESDDADEVEDLGDNRYRIWIGESYGSEGPSLDKSIEVSGGNHEFVAYGTSVHISCSATLVGDEYDFANLDGTTGQITDFEVTRWQGDREQTSCDPDSFDNGDPQPDVDIDKSVDADGPVAVDGAFTYTIDVSYTGDDAATAEDVVVDDELDLLDDRLEVTGVQLDGQDALASEACQLAGGDLTCSLGDMDFEERSNASIEIAIAVASDAEVCGEAVDNVATATWETDGQAQSEPVTVEFVDCPEPDTELTIEKTASTGSVDLGGSFDYEITVRNDGDDPSDAFTVVDDIPEPFTVDEVTAVVDHGDHTTDESRACISSAGFDSTDGEEFVDCSLERLGAGEAFVVTITVDVPDTAECETITNEAVLYDSHTIMGAAVPTAEGGEDEGPLLPRADVDPEDEIGRDDVDVEVTGCAPPPPPSNGAPGDGEVTVAKVVDGDAPDDVDAFAFVLTCGDDTDSILLNDGDDRTVTGIDDGTTCSVEELSAQGADEVTWEITGDVAADGEGTETTSFTVDEDDEILVTFTNEYADVLGEGEVESDISIVKDAIAGVDEDDDGLVVTLGDGDEATVTYRYLITNEGEDALADLTLDDDQIGDLTDEFVEAVEAAFGEPVLPVDESVEVEADHTVSDASFDGGELVNVATVAGIGTESGDEVTDDDDEVVGLVQVMPEAEEEPEPETDVAEIAYTGANTSSLTGLGVLFTMLGLGALLLTGGRRRMQE